MLSFFYHDDPDGMHEQIFIFYSAFTVSEHNNTTLIVSCNVS